jgi:hypothetical protein
MQGNTVMQREARSMKHEGHRPATQTKLEYYRKNSSTHPISALAFPRTLLLELRHNLLNHLARIFCAERVGGKG